MSVSAGEWVRMYIFICVCNCTWANTCILYVRSTFEAAGLWMCLPGAPVVCSKCVSISLINSNTGDFGTCGQVNETQWEGTSPWFPPHQEAAGDGMRFSSSLPLSLSAPPPPPSPTGQSDALFIRPSCWDVSLLLLLFCLVLLIVNQSVCHWLCSWFRFLTERRSEYSLGHFGVFYRKHCVIKTF